MHWSILLPVSSGSCSHMSWLFLFLFPSKRKHTFCLFLISNNIYFLLFLFSLWFSFSSSYRLCFLAPASCKMYDSLSIPSYFIKVFFPSSLQKKETPGRFVFFFRNSLLSLQSSFLLLLLLLFTASTINVFLIWFNPIVFGSLSAQQLLLFFLLHKTFQRNN